MVTAAELVAELETLMEDASQLKLETTQVTVVLLARIYEVLLQIEDKVGDT